MWLYNIFPHYLTNGMIFGNIIEHKMFVLIFSTNFEIFLVLRRTGRDIITNAHKSLYRVIKNSLCTWHMYCNNQVHRDFLITRYNVLITLVIFLKNTSISSTEYENSSNIKFRETAPSENRVVSCERRERERDMRLIVAFRNFAKGRKVWLPRNRINL